MVELMSVNTAKLNIELSSGYFYCEDSWMWSSNFIDWSVIWLADLILNIHDCDLFDFLALVMSFKKDY